MSIINSAPFFVAKNSRSGYTIDQSLRFNTADSATLTRTPVSASNQKTYTFSFWHKGTARHDDKKVFVVGATSVTSGFVELSATGSGSGGKAGIRHSGNSLITSAIYRDPSAWAHYVFAFDSTQATDTNRLKLYVNGEQVTITGTWFAQDAVSRVNSTDVHTIGVGRNSSGTNELYLDAYLAEFNFIDGTALTPSSFGETDTITGAWIPKKYSGSYGTNGFYLKFDPSATNGIGHDHSGNGNNWTANNFSTSGTGTDVMSDTPTTNWCTLNPLDSGQNLSEGNLTCGSSNSHKATRATFAMTTGKWYWECDAGTWSNGPAIGIMKPDAILSNQLDATGTRWFRFDGNRWYDGSSGSYGTAVTSGSGSIIGMAYDGDNGTLTVYVNGTSQGTAFTGLKSGQTPNLGSSTSDTWVPATKTYDGSFNVNFGQRAFAYTPPTGFKALNTSNLPAPTIKKGSKYFNTVTYAGNGGSNTITTGMDHSSGGGLLWIKNRTTTANHDVLDNVRGLDQLLELPSTAAEYTYTSSNLAATSTGYTLNTSSGQFNASSNNYVAWNWLAGGSGSSNTAGSITSTVSANATAGFSIVTYTGNGTSGATVGHGLSVKPSFLIVRRRPTTSNWTVYHSSVGATKRLVLDSTVAATAGTGFWNDTEPTSTVFTIGNDGGTNSTTDNTYVAYCFSEVAGYSKFGSYTGNGSSDGVFIHLGFKPAFFMWKVTSTTGSWGILDFKRDTYNVSGKQLFPNQSNAEASYTVCDLLSNGIKMRNTFGDTNGSGSTYIFAAFAEHPFKYANAR